MIQIDIPMPESCRDCPFEMYYMNCGETRCRATGMILADGYKAIPFEDRHPDCPLMEVVKCKDCKYYTSVTAHCEVRGKGLYLIRGKDDWCSRGKRREE